MRVRVPAWASWDAAQPLRRPNTVRGWGGGKHAQTHTHACAHAHPAWSVPHRSINCGSGTRGARPRVGAKARRRQQPHAWAPTLPILCGCRCVLDERVLQLWGELGESCQGRRLQAQCGHLRDRRWVPEDPPLAVPQVSVRDGQAGRRRQCVVEVVVSIVAQVLVAAVAAAVARRVQHARTASHSMHAQVSV